jgi:hypothetical protein
MTEMQMNLQNLAHSLNAMTAVASDRISYIQGTGSISFDTEATPELKAEVSVLDTGRVIIKLSHGIRLQFDAVHAAAQFFGQEYIFTFWNSENTVHIAFKSI